MGVFKIVVEWKDSVGLDPFVYETDYLSRMYEIFRNQLSRPEAKSVKVILPSRG